MKEESLSAWIISSSDSHASEYVSDHWRGRAWISGFTGSAGTVVILEDKAGLWADGRYFIQAEAEIEGSGIDLFKFGLPDTILFEDWIVQELSENATVGYDGKVMSYDFLKTLKKKSKTKNILVRTDLDILNDIWSDRPSLPTENIFDHDVKYAGKSRAEKLKDIRAEMTKENASHHLITTLDDIAWLYNYRGNDIPCCPFTLAYTLIFQEGARLFIDTRKVPDSLREDFLKDNIEVCEYTAIDQALSDLKETSALLFDPKTVNGHFIELLSDEVLKIEGRTVTTMMKSLKNAVEQEHSKECHRKDGAAMVKFLKFLDENVPRGSVTEISASDMAEKYRSEIDTFKGLSFTTIPAYGPNAAMMHYSTSEETSCVIGEDNFFLVDSGGQYLDGTTDITRTMNYGPLNEQQRKDYTLVLRSHIALAKAKFMKGARGCQLDMLARGPVWDQAIDYACGTGHGVGYFLNVHEGPQSISTRFIDEEMRVGMNITNEPGIYRKDKWGIRIENIYFVKEFEVNEFGTFYEFDTVTVCPINIKPVIKEMMLSSEIEWLNDYHRYVYKQLCPYLDESEQAWLKENTKAF